MLLLLFSAPHVRAAEPVFASGMRDVLPAKSGPDALALHGEWKFKYVASSAVGGDETFHRPSCDVAAWQTTCSDSSICLTLVPLGPTWPALLTKWLGAAAAFATPWQPFHHTYDQ